MTSSFPKCLTIASGSNNVTTFHQVITGKLDSGKIAVLYSQSSLSRVCLNGFTTLIKVYRVCLNGFKAFIKV